MSTGDHLIWAQPR